jgi:hypothetical protein
MGYTLPNVSYNISVTNLKFNTTEAVTVGSMCKVSYNHKIILNLIPNNCGLDQFDIRVTDSDDPWDIDQGKLLNRATNLRQGISHECEFSINPETFPTVGEYRIGLYARSALDDSWDVTYLFFTLTEQSGTEQFILADNTPFEVITTRDTQD